jgi:hypothetical protein
MDGTKRGGGAPSDGTVYRTTISALNPAGT